jgi:Phosphotransferase enzyme family
MPETNIIWMQPAWFEKASCWIDNELYRQGIKRTGSIKQPHIRHWSTVLQIPTSIGNIYFKAVIPELAYESALTQTLSDWYPQCMPQILAIAREDGWLLMSDGGMRLREILKTEDDIQHWQVILPIYAELQKKSAQHLNELLSLGVPDRRLAVLPFLYQKLLNNHEVLATNKPSGLSLFECQRLQDTVDLFTSLCKQLAAFGVPETLYHGDLHDGNVFIRDGHYMFFDWGDSSISHPLFTIQNTYASLKRRFGLEKNSPWFERLRDCYLESWAEYQIREKLEVAFEIAEQLSSILDALRWLPVLSNMDEATRNKYIGAVPSLLREFLSTIQV